MAEVTKFKIPLNTDHLLSKLPTGTIIMKEITTWKIMNSMGSSSGENFQEVLFEFLNKQ